MILAKAVLILLLSWGLNPLTVTTAFVPFAPPKHSPLGSCSTRRFSAVADKDTSTSTQTQQASQQQQVDVSTPAPATKTTGVISNEQVNQRLAKQLAKMRQKDELSLNLQPDDLSIVYDDDHIVVVDKPVGVLTVAGKNDVHSLAKAVCTMYPDCEMARLGSDRMVVHRLNMDASGLVVFAKTLEAVRGMNTLFRTRKIHRTYEAVVAGHVQPNKGLINLPLMRDYECPPFVRISTEEHQEQILGLDPDVVGKKLYELPKDSVTRFKVLSRQEMDGQPVTRLTLTNVSGRTHQLNCHLAALGHPIVGDDWYGIGGDALPDGGLREDEFDYMIDNPNRASAEVQQSLKESVSRLHCHAKSVSFRHPVTKQDVSLQSDVPF